MERPSEWFTESGSVAQELARLRAERHGLRQQDRVGSKIINAFCSQKM